MNKVAPIDEEFVYEGSVIISQTDLKGIITYANKAFCTVSAYKQDELIGASHNLIRHPDMPKEAFFKMWETVKGGQSWNGIVKNLRKDGLYYWVETEVLPVKNEENEITGYIAARRTAAEKNVKETKEIYAKMLEQESKE